VVFLTILGSHQCVNCKSEVMYYVKFVIFALIQLMIVLFSISTNLRKSSQIKSAIEKDDLERLQRVKQRNLGILLKININFLQILAIIMSYDFVWPKGVKISFYVG
jgi:hypothetical protein